jgi:hypothetical protein
MNYFHLKNIFIVLILCHVIQSHIVNIVNIVNIWKDKNKKTENQEENLVDIRNEYNVNERPS